MMRLQKLLCLSVALIVGSVYSVHAQNAARGARRRVCACKLFTLSCHWENRSEPVLGSAAVPHPCSALSGRSARRSSRRGPLHRTSGHAWIHPRCRPSRRFHRIPQDSAITAL